ncbi:major facilitator superfamily domain-containing protein [Kalaharituber pfeilii]|nr:major facilitator superfamily domain-containing protein [Kalaharituber pfeilii]
MDDLRESNAAFDVPYDLEKATDNHGEREKSATKEVDRLDEIGAETPSDSTNASTKHSFPDGGFDAWLQVVSGFILYTNTWGLVNMWGVFQTHYSSQTPPLASQSAISWIGSIQTCLFLFVGAFCGRPFDLGYARTLSWSGTIIIVIALLLTSLSGEFNGNGRQVYWQVLLSQGFLLGIGLGLTLVPPVAVASSYFKRKRGLAISLCTVGGSVGGILYPIILREMLPKLGHHWALRALALIVLCLCMLACFLLKQRTDIIDRSTTGDVHQGLKGQLVSGIRLLKDIIWGDWSYIMYMNAMFWTCMGMYSPLFYVESFTLKANIELKGMGSIYLVSIMNAGGIVGRIFCGWLADMIGPITTQFICTTISAIVVFSWLSINTIGSLLTFTVIYGLLSGAILSLAPTCSARLTSNISVVGTRMGVMFCVFSFSTLAGPPITGAFAGTGEDKGQDAAKIWIGSMLLLGGMVMLGTRLLKGEPC